MVDDDDDTHGEPAEEIHFLSVPDVAAAFERMLNEFSRETDRGSILIAADIVSTTLESVIQALRPEEFEAKRLRNLLRYPGPLATFAARADIALLAGFIDGNAHGSIDKLRKLRNAAAHSQSAFSLADHRDTLREICDLGPGTAAGVNRFAIDFLIRNVVHNLMEKGVELESEIVSNPFSSPADVLDELRKRPERMKMLEDRLPRMELAFGVWLLLGLIRHKERALLALRAAPAAIQRRTNAHDR